MKRSSYTGSWMPNCKIYSTILLWLCLTGFSATSHTIENAYAAFADGDGNIYNISSNGKLHWYQHNGRMTGADTWGNFGQAKIVFN